VVEILAYFFETRCILATNCITLIYCFVVNSIFFLKYLRMIVCDVITVSNLAFTNALLNILNDGLMALSDLILIITENLICLPQ